MSKVTSAQPDKAIGRYRKVQVRTWGDSKFRTLSPITPCGQGLWLFLITGPHTGPIPGLFHAGRAAMAEALDWDLEAFDKAFNEVFSEGMAKADFDARVVWIQNAIKHNQPASPNVVRSWGNEFDLIPECDLKWEALESLRANVYALGEAYAKAFNETFNKTSGKTSGKPSGKPSPKTMPNQEQEQEQEITTLSGNPDESLKDQAKEVLEYLNTKTGRNYRLVEVNTDLVVARLKAGAAVSDCKAIIDAKTTQWADDEKMREYLRPVTLFNRTKFEQYLGEIGGNGVAPSTEWEGAV